jgi:hypothetical protein
LVTRAFLYINGEKRPFFHLPATTMREKVGVEARCSLLLRQLDGRRVRGRAAAREVAAAETAGARSALVHVRTRRDAGAHRKVARLGPPLLLQLHQQLCCIVRLRCDSALRIRHLHRTPFSLHFSDVCPEPVLVNRSYFGETWLTNGGF